MAKRRERKSLKTFFFTRSAPRLGARFLLHVADLPRQAFLNQLEITVNVDVPARFRRANLCSEEQDLRYEGRLAASGK
jgi:hypothetical protein